MVNRRLVVHVAAGQDHTLIGVGSLSQDRTAIQQPAV